MMTRLNIKLLSNKLNKLNPVAVAVILYIYIYACVCVCVRAWKSENEMFGWISKKNQIGVLKNKYIFVLFCFDFFFIFL